MNSPLLMVPWLLLAVPAVSVLQWLELRKKKEADYAYFVERKEFPFLKIAGGKLAFFGLVGAASLAYSVPMDKTIVALVVLGVCGFYVESSIALGRPHPTPGYQIAKQVCQKCGSGTHDGCTNLRTLEGFETGFKTAGGYKSPVCCCGFRLGEWEEVSV